MEQGGGGGEAMRPYLFVPFLREALEKNLRGCPLRIVYPTKTYLVAQGGGLCRLKVVVRKAPEGRFSGHNWSTSLAGGMGFLSCILTA
jgi:hypothetical protein